MTNDCHVFSQQFQRDLLTSHSTVRPNSMSACAEEEKCLNRLKFTQQSRSDAKYFCSDRMHFLRFSARRHFQSKAFGVRLRSSASPSELDRQGIPAQSRMGKTLEACGDVLEKNRTSVKEDTFCSSLRWGKTNGRKHAALSSFYLQLSHTQWVKSSGESSCLFKVNGGIIFSSFHRLQWPHLDFTPRKTSSRFHFRLQKHFSVLEAEIYLIDIVKSRLQLWQPPICSIFSLSFKFRSIT